MTTGNTTDTTLTPHNLAQTLAEECYSRYKAHYEREQSVRVAEWKDLPNNVQRRWEVAVAPTATKLVEHEYIKGYLHEAETRLAQLRESDERASERLARLERTIADAEKSLHDLLALGSVPGPFVELVRELSAALEETHPVAA